VVANNSPLPCSHQLPVKRLPPLLPLLNIITMEDEARNVDVSYKINCISHIDSVTSTYYVDVKLFFHWIDPNFIGRKKNETIDIKAEGSWNPDIIVTNEHELSSVEAHREVKVNDPVKGEVKSSIQYRGTLFINVSITVLYLLVSTVKLQHSCRIWTLQPSRSTAKTSKSA
jgi:hypothetical protein